MSLRAHHLLLALAACNGSSSEDPGSYGPLNDPRVTVLDEGAGPTNALPLEPVTLGTVAEYARDTRVWVGELDAGADTLSIQTVWTSFPSLPGVSGTALYRRAREGLVVHALDHHLHPDAYPVLLVPDEVRLGMSWTSEYLSGNLNQETVVAHTTADTPLGPVEAWGIAELDEEQIAKVRWYGEGIGRIALERTVETSWPGGSLLDALIVPLDPQQHAELSQDPVVLEPMLDPFGRSLDLAQQPIGLRLEQNGGTTRVLTHEYVPDNCDYCTELFPVECFTLEEWPRLAPEGCPDDFLDRDTPLQLLYAARLAAGLDRSNIAAWFEGDEAQYLDLGLVSTTQPEFTLTRGSPDGPRERLVDAIPDFDTALFNTLPRQVVGTTHVQPGEPVVLAVRHEDGRVYELRVVEGRVEGYDYVGYAPGAPTLVTTESAIEAYTLTSDSRLFGVVVQDGHVRVLSYGDLLVDDDSASWDLIAAAIDPNDPGAVIAAVTERPYYTSDGAWEGIPKYGWTLLRGELRRDPIDATGPATLGLRFGRSPQGIVLCWPPTDEPLDREGWTLRGEPADVYGPGGPSDSCLTIADDAEVPPEWEQAPNAVEGRVPGIGRVRVGFSGRDLPERLNRYAATTRDGGVVALSGARFDEHGLQLTGPTPTSGIAIESAFHVVRDASAHGMYLWQYPDEEVWNEGGDVAIPPGMRFRGLVQDGGAVVSAGSSWQLARPSGLTEVPPAQVQALGLNTGVVALRDGRICWLGSRVASCAAPDGSVESTSTDVSYGGDGLWPLSDGSLLAPAAQGPSGAALSQRFDPDAMTITPYDPSGFIQLIASADGRSWAIQPGPWPDPDRFVELRPDGPVEVLPDLLNSGVDPLVLPLAEEFLALDAREHWHRVAR